MLKLTGVKLEKISDIDKYLFIEKANNKYMNDYDPKRPSTFISYLDMNNLHGWAMSEDLPYEEFKWFKNVDVFDVMSV